MSTTLIRPPAPGDSRNDRSFPTPAAPVLVLMGVSGSGKSTIAGMLSGRLGWDHQEGDDLHPDANVAKMASGRPLTDADRWPWLDRVADWIDRHRAENRPGIVTCSALKASYRDRLRTGNVVFVHLAAGPDTIRRRLAARTGHYMPASLLDSQFATLEPPADGADQTLVVGSQLGPDQVAAEIIRRLGLTADIAAAR